MEFNISSFGTSIQQSWSSKDASVSSGVESSSSCCLTQEFSTMDHEFLTKTEDNLPMESLAIPSGEASYMEEEVNSAWSSTDNVGFAEPYILKPLPVPLRNDSMQCGSLETTSRATKRRTTHEKRCPHSCRSTWYSPFSSNVPFLYRYHCGSKRKAGTYNGEDVIHPFAQRKIFPSTLQSSLLASTRSEEYRP